MTQVHSKASTASFITADANILGAKTIQSLSSDELAPLAHAVIDAASNTLDIKQLLTLLLNQNSYKQLTSMIYQLLLQTAIDGEFYEKIQAEPWQHTSSRTGMRNGTRTTSVTVPGQDVHIELEVPKLRKGTFYPEALKQARNLEGKVLSSIVAELYISGVSTRKISELVEVLELRGISRSSVSQLCSELDELVDQFRNRTLTGNRYPVLYIDATYLKIREEKNGSYSSKAFALAIGVNEQGTREVLGFDVLPSEGGTFWCDFLRSLKTRGLLGTKLLVSDAHEGIKKAVTEVLNGCVWQRCAVHVERNILERLKRRSHDENWKSIYMPIIRRALNASDMARGQEAWKELITTLEEHKEYDAVKTATEAQDDVFSFITFPPEARQKLRTNNLCERVNREIKRRYNQAGGMMPTEKSALRLIGSVLINYHEEWAQKHYISQSVMQDLKRC